MVLQWRQLLLTDAEIEGVTRSGDRGELADAMTSLRKGRKRESWQKPEIDGGGRAISRSGQHDEMAAVLLRSSQLLQRNVITPLGFPLYPLTCGLSPQRSRTCTNHERIAGRALASNARTSRPSRWVPAGLHSGFTCKEVNPRPDNRIPLSLSDDYAFSPHHHMERLIRTGSTPNSLYQPSAPPQS